MKYKELSIAGPKGDNQDAILTPLCVNDVTWCGIADGVGSTSLGGLAARTSLDEVKNAITADDEMSEIFAKVSRRIDELVSRQESPKSASTTLSLLCIKGMNAHVGHVGDTRITHLRGGGVMARSKDQTEVQKLVDDGVLSKHQARRYPRRNVLLSAMSSGGKYDLYQSAFSLEPGDRVLLTSDGFHGRFFRKMLASLSSEYPDFDEFWLALEGLATRESFDDDASCLAIEIE